MKQVRSSEIKKALFFSRLRAKLPYTYELWCWARHVSGDTNEGPEKLSRALPMGPGWTLPWEVPNKSTEKLSREVRKRALYISFHT